MTEAGDNPYPATDIATQETQIARRDEDGPQSANDGEKAKVDGDNNGEEGSKDQKKDDPKIINNIVHIDQKGANINITNVTNH